MAARYQCDTLYGCYHTNFTAPEAMPLTTQLSPSISSPANSAIPSSAGTLNRWYSQPVQAHASTSTYDYETIVNSGFSQDQCVANQATDINRSAVIQLGCCFSFYTCAPYPTATKPHQHILHDSIKSRDETSHIHYVTVLLGARNLLRLPIKQNHKTWIINLSHVHVGIRRAWRDTRYVYIASVTSRA